MYVFFIAKTPVCLYAIFAENRIWILSRRPDRRNEAGDRPKHAAEAPSKGGGVCFRGKWKHVIYKLFPPLARGRTGKIAKRRSADENTGKTPP
jgi:hypothetical protein